MTPTEEERIQALKILENSYEMYENSKAETIDARKNRKDKEGNRIYTDKSLESTLELMNTMQEDIKEKYLELGGKEEDLLVKKEAKKTSTRKKILQAIENANNKDAMKEYIEKINGLNENQEVKKETPSQPDISKTVSPILLEPDEDFIKKVERKGEPIESIEKNYVDKMSNLSSKGVTGIKGHPDPAGELGAEGMSMEDFKKLSQNIEDTTGGIKIEQNNRSGYDSIKLPSKGECYKNKLKEIEVGYLTAYDENLILSPNLYKNGTFLDHILKNKIRTDINPDNLIQGDRDAIIIWLRASGYGNEYPVSMIDDKTGKEFKTVIDLSKLNYKKFKLKGDENGYFNFKLPNSGDEIKFKFLTNADAKKLEEMRAEEDKEIKVTKFKQCAREMRSAINDNELINDEQYEKIKDSIDSIETLILEDFDKIPETYYTHDLTNRLILSTISVNGITDRKEIVNYVLNMNIKDAQAYRNYIIENEPGIDYNIKVKRPDSLGGGYIDTFLRLDQFIFIN